MRFFIQRPGSLGLTFLQAPKEGVPGFLILLTGKDEKGTKGTGGVVGIKNRQQSSLKWSQTIMHGYIIVSLEKGG